MHLNKHLNSAVDCELHLDTNMNYSHGKSNFKKTTTLCFYCIITSAPVGGDSELSFHLPNEDEEDAPLRNHVRNHVTGTNKHWMKAIQF